LTSGHVMDDQQFKDKKKVHFLNNDTNSASLPTLPNFLSVPYLLDNPADVLMLGDSQSTALAAQLLSTLKDSINNNTSGCASAQCLQRLSHVQIDCSNHTYGPARANMTTNGNNSEKYSFERREPMTNSCSNTTPTKKTIGVQTDLCGLHNRLLLIDYGNEKYKHEIFGKENSTHLSLSPLVTTINAKTVNGGNESTCSVTSKGSPSIYSSLHSSVTTFKHERKKQKSMKQKRKKNKDLAIKIEATDSSGSDTAFTSYTCERNSMAIDEEYLPETWSDNKSNTDFTPLFDTNCDSKKNKNMDVENTKLNPLLESLCGPDMTCLQCCKPFKQKAHLQRHVKEQHFANELEHVCAICNKAFHQKANLMSHMLTHLKNRTFSHPFKCLLCESSGLERKFTRKSSLRRHVETKHPSCDKDAPWIAAQRKPRIARQLCDNLNAKHLMARKHTKKHLQNKHIKSEIIKPTLATHSNNNHNDNNNNNNNNDLVTNENNNNGACNTQLGQIFPEMFLFQNPELFDQLVSSKEHVETVECLKVNDNIDMDNLTEMYEDMPPLIPQQDVVMKSEKENKIQK